MPGGQGRRRQQTTRVPLTSCGHPFHLWPVAPQALSSPWGAHSRPSGAEGRWEEPSPSTGDARPLGCRQGGRAEDLQVLVWERGDGQVQVYLVDWGPGSHAQITEQWTSGSPPVIPFTLGLQ